MIIKEIKFKEIIELLKHLPKTKEYTTHSIATARGKYRYKNSFINRLKKLING